jgi:hypothetical protein
MLSFNIIDRLSYVSETQTQTYSLEDLSIGFQCRIDRDPDIYNVIFWDHFTNVYI